MHRREVVREAAAHTLQDWEKLHQAAAPEPADRTPQTREMQLQEAVWEAAHTLQDQEKLHQAAAPEPADRTRQVREVQLRAAVRERAVRMKRDQVKGHTQQDRALQVLAAQLLAVRGRSAPG